MAPGFDGSLAFFRHYSCVRFVVVVVLVSIGKMQFDLCAKSVPAVLHNSNSNSNSAWA